MLVLIVGVFKDIMKGLFDFEPVSYILFVNRLMYIGEITF